MSTAENTGSGASEFERRRVTECRCWRVTQKLYDEIETAVNAVTTQVGSNPTVNAVLTQILGELGI